jgi:hypothetical protein
MALSLFLIRSERWTHIARIHLRQAFRQISPVQQRLIPQLVPQFVTKVPILAGRAQVAEEA